MNYRDSAVEAVEKYDLRKNIKDSAAAALHHGHQGFSIMLCHDEAELIVRALASLPTTEVMTAQCDEGGADREATARKLLADEWRRDGRDELAKGIEKGNDSEWSKSAPAVRAIMAALSHHPTPIAQKSGSEGEWDGPLTDEEQAMIDRAWERHKAAGPICNVPPEGWQCSRGAGHEGPCAATPATPAPSDQEKLVGELLPFTSHPVGCAVYGSWVAGEPACSCGLDDLRARARRIGERS